MPKFNVKDYQVNEKSESVELYYSISGLGPHKVLFISGLGAIAHQWDHQAKFFSSLPEFSVCIYDNRGSGFSDCPTGPYTTRMLADDAVALLEHLRWEKVHIVGLSMGGMIAQELACKLQDRVMSLALISTYSKFNGLPAFDNIGLASPFKLVLFHSSFLHYLIICIYIVWSCKDVSYCSSTL